MQRNAILMLLAMVLFLPPGVLATTVAPMACFECDYEEPRQPPPRPPSKKGVVEPVVWTNDHADLVGWACQEGSTGPIDVHLYVGAPAYVGQFIVGTTANQYSEPQVAQQCGVSGSWHRFKIPLLENIRTQHPGKALYAYAVSWVGDPVMLANSGQVTVPAIVNDAVFVAQDLPQVMQPNSTYTARVQMRNTGNTIWNDGALYRLGAQNPHDNTIWGTARVAVTGTVAPGETATFDFTIRAPATTGARNFQWRMVRDGVAWFGATTPNAAINIASGSLAASPNPCTIPWGADRCTSTVQWSSSAANAEVWVTDLAGNNPALLARSQSGTSVVPWITSSGARFHLKAGGWSSPTLAAHDVRGRLTINALPQVAMTEPASGHNVLVGGSVAMSASATDADDGIARVEFLVDGIRVGEDSNAPYALSWVPTQARDHALSARAIDTRGGVAASAVVNLRVTAPAPTPAGVMLTRDYVYDAHHRLCKIVEPETGATVIGYDAAGNESWRASGLDLPSPTSCDHTGAWNSGRVIARRHDARNRVATVAFPDGRGNQAWTYTADGLPATITTRNDSAEVINTYQYNARGLLVGEGVQQPERERWIAYDYDANGHRYLVVTPDGQAIYSLVNAFGQPMRIINREGFYYAFGATYYPNGALKQFTYGNGIVHTMSQNGRQLPDRSTDVFNGVAVLDDSYAYDAVGNVAALSDGATGRNQRGNRTMAYDGLDRLTSVTSPMFGAATYAYDALDNLTRVRITGGNAARDHAYCYDASNRLTNVKNGSCGGASVIGLGYDVQGNVTNKNGQGYVFDYGNRLRESVGKERYRYDGHGRRLVAFDVEAKRAPIWSQYSQDGQLLFQQDERRSLNIPHVYLGGNLIATVETNYVTNVSRIRYQHTDALGSPVVVTDEQRNVVERSEYEPYGKLLNRPIADGVAYTGHVMDAATGLLYMQQRYYDPQIGATLSVDPVTAYDNGDMRFFNRYAYAANNPYRFIDPDGRCQVDLYIVMLPCGTPQSMKDPVLVAAEQQRGADGRRIVQVIAVSAAAGAATAVAVEAGAVEGVKQAAKSEAAKRVVCAVLACKGVDPKDAKSQTDFKRAPEVQVVDDAKAASSIRPPPSAKPRAQEPVPPPPPPPIPTPKPLTN